MGTAIRKAFAQTPDGQYEVLSLALSRSHEFGLISLDLMKMDEVDRVFKQFRPDCELHCWQPIVNTTVIYLSGVIHCAAERRPDVAEKVSLVRKDYHCACYDLY